MISVCFFCFLRSFCAEFPIVVQLANVREPTCVKQFYCLCEVVLTRADSLIIDCLVWFQSTNTILIISAFLVLGCPPGWVSVLYLHLVRFQTRIIP